MNKALFVYVAQPTMDFALAKKRDYFVKRDPQIGLAYLAASLRQEGCESEILDFSAEFMEKFEFVNYVLETKPLFIGFYAATAIQERVLDYIKILKLSISGVKICVGGPDMYSDKVYLEAGADMYCQGEGDLTIKDIYWHYKRNEPIESIEGISYLKDGEYVKTARPLIQDLDTLPIPAWDLYDLKNYHNYHIFDMKTPYASIMASRGCPFRCSYCISHKIWGGQVRIRSVKNIMQEISYLIESKGVKYVYFQDDIFGWNNEKWVLELCEALREKNIRWACVLHPLSFLGKREKIISRMAGAGCSFITTGLQSANPQILKNINRSIKEPETLAELVRIANKCGIITSVDFIFGLQGETEETMEETLKYALDHDFTWCAFYHLSVLPGSEVEAKNSASSLPFHFIEKKTKEISRRFFLHPKKIFQLLWIAVFRNPTWSLRILSNLRNINYVKEIAGF